MFTFSIPLSLALEELQDQSPYGTYDKPTLVCVEITWIRETHRLIVIIFTLDSAFAIELEAIGALVEPMKLGRRRVAGNGHTRARQPRAILCALDLKGSPVGAGRTKTIQ